MMPHDPEEAEDAEVIDLDGDVDFEAIASGDRYVVGRRGERHEIWDARDRTVVRTFEGARGRRNAWLEFKALEERQHELRRRTTTRWSVVGSLVLAIAIVVGATIALSLGGSSSSTIPSNAAQGPDTMRVENVEGGYAFRAPAGWSDLQEGDATVLTGPNGEVTVSVDVATTDDLEAAATARVGSVTAGWSDVVVEAPQQRLVGAAPAVSVGGTGTDPGGESFRYVTIGVLTSARTYTIAIVVRESADPALTTPGIEGILSSFRVPAA
ncbi:MAG: hypothetical protein ABI572_09845 [Actinomycetota bacterium]